MDASVNRIPSSQDEKSLLLALRIKRQNIIEVEYSLEELRLLVKTAGAIVMDTKIVNRDHIDASYIIGKGFLEELKGLLQEKDITMIVFDLNNIRPAQVRNLEEYLKCRVVGRTEVILDIFARRARSSEAMIQVELAQLNYIMPRLKGLGGVLSRLGGGIGTRGPGEKMLETDRRHVQRRITALSRKLDNVKKHRERTRKSRQNAFVGVVAGYTNAGKSTLINMLAKDDLFVEDRLFATLDSYTRNVYLEEGKHTLLSDTVGFIRNLPANLVESFRSTLEEIECADYIVHVIDISALDVDMNIKTVEAELITLDSVGKPTILYFNKADVVDEQRKNLVTTKYPEAIIGSATTGDGIKTLKAKLIELYNQHNATAQLVL